MPDARAALEPARVHARHPVRLRGRRRRIVALITVSVWMACMAACRRAQRGPSPALPIPAGFVEQTGHGWRVAVPTTWAPPSDPLPGVWVVVDPQAVEDYHANVNVVTEPFAGESRTYAAASETALRRDRQATVQVTREDTIDGDTTLITESAWAPRAPSTVSFRTMQAHLASRGMGYVVTCAVSANAFERYRSTCESVLRSFAVER